MWRTMRAQRYLLLLLFAMVLISCESDGELLGESQYQAALVGDWQGVVGDEKESISFHADGSFSCEEMPTGFISNTLSQGAADTISGTWILRGSVITLAIDSASSEQPMNIATTSTIVSFHENRLVITSDTGQSSSFIRAM
jgi:hypothetical protein